MAAFNMRYQSVGIYGDDTSSKEDDNTNKIFEASGMLPDQELRRDTEISHPTAPIDDRTFWQKCNSLWVWELLSCFISMGCLGVVIWALVALDHSPLSDWPVRSTPASFISTFVTISRFSVLVGVAEGIAQLRWFYYLGGARPLHHLDSFDSASRGPWGSFLFTCQIRIKGMTSLIARFGTMIMIIAMAMDPFAQQIIQFSTQIQPYPNSEGAWMPATKINHDTTSLFAAKRQALYGGILGVNETIPFGCPSGNCEWDIFSTLGYHIACEDIANTAVKSCLPGAGILGENCTVIRHTAPATNLSLDLHNGSSSVDQDGLRAFSLLKSTTSDAHPNGIQDPTNFNFFVAQLLIQRKNDQFDGATLNDPSWNLTSCSVRWCSKIYEGIQVKNGTLADHPPQVVDLIPLANSSCWTQQPPVCQQFVPVNTSIHDIYTSPIGDSDFQVRNFLDFDYDVEAFSNNTVPNQANLAALSLTAGLLWNADIPGVFADVEKSLTDFVRTNSGSFNVSGTEYLATTFTEVNWGWFSLPAATVLSGAAFLIWVIIYTARGINGEKFIWKSNTIPLLMHGLEGYHRHGYAGAETTGAIFNTARQMRVQLRRNDDGEIRFVKT